MFTFPFKANMLYNMKDINQKLLVCLLTENTVNANIFKNKYFIKKQHYPPKL